MPDVTGEMLREWRRSRGWDVPEMARRLRQAASEPIAAHNGLVKMIRAWETGGHAISERYELLYRAALDGATARDAALRARDRAAALPDARDITAIAAAAMSRPGGLTLAESRRVVDLARRAISDLEQIRKTLGTLTALLGDDTTGDHDGGQ
jgi:transcriptional regulator with XRE-family HTH domain